MMAGGKVVLAANAAGAATAVAPAIPTLAALTAEEAVMLIALPLLATWLGLAGLAIQEGQPSGQIMRDVTGRFMLGGVAAIIAWGGIDWMELRGVYAALFTLAIGMGILTIARALKNATITLAWLDPLFAMVGLQRTDKDKDGDET